MRIVLRARRRLAVLALAAALVACAEGVEDGGAALAPAEAGRDPKVVRTDTRSARARDGEAAHDEGARVLAESVLDAVQTDDDREYWRIEFPRDLPNNGPASARVLWGRLCGFADQRERASYELCRVTFRDGRVAASELRFPRDWNSWRGRPSPPIAREFDLSLEDFDRGWSAMQLILQAVAHEPPEGSPLRERRGGGGSSDHPSGDDIGVYLGDNASPIYADGFERCEFLPYSVRTWPIIKAAAVISVWRRVLQEAGAKTAPAASWGEIAASELRIAADAARKRRTFGEDANLGALFLVAGEYGSEDCASSIGRIASGSPALQWEADLADSMLRMRHHWDSSYAARILRAGPPEPGHWHPAFLWFTRSSIIPWTKRRFHEMDPAGFRSFLVSDARRNNGAHCVEAMADLRFYGGRDALVDLEGLLDHPNPSVRVEAAFGCLEIERQDTAALRAIDAVARDVTLDADGLRSHDARAPRTRALRFVTIEAAPEQRRWSEADLVGQASAKGERGEVISFLLDMLTDVNRMPPDAETRVWRGALECNERDGLCLAARALIRLDDRESAPRVRWAVECLERDGISGARELREAYDAWGGK